MTAKQYNQQLEEILNQRDYGSQISHHKAKQLMTELKEQGLKSGLVIGHYLDSKAN